MRTVFVWMVIACLMAGVKLVSAAEQNATDTADDTVIAQTRTLTATVHAYAEVTPVARLPIRARAAGVVASMHVHPGDRVAAGDVLGQLGGPDIDASLAQDKAIVRSAEATVEAARQTLKVQRQKQSERLGTRLKVYEAEGQLARAQAGLEGARAALKAARASTQITVPVDAKVLAVEVANGERVDPGQTLVMLEGDDSLWLTAVFYGREAAAVHPGMRGKFSALGVGRPIAVRVRDVIGRVQSDGGETVGLVPTASGPAWRSGQAGVLTLRGPAHAVVTIPNRALILDEGKWWVLVQDRRKVQPRQVVLGARRGSWTVIARGLKAGERVVVINAYLRFHRDFATRYQPPD